jgi:hypothetical protein
VIPGLRGDHRLLNASQQLLRLGQCQSQIRYIGETGRSMDLNQVDTVHRRVRADFGQSQNPPHR